MTTVIIDYGAGNLRSAQKAFERAAAELSTSQEVIVTGKVEDLQKATRIVLPGVGSFSDCKAGILAIDGMVEALEYSVMDLGLPFLGICVGMQLLATRSLENGEHRGFEWIQGDVVKIKKEANYPIPHMGWNSIDIAHPSPMLNDITQKAYLYFVHSYYVEPLETKIICTETTYGIPFVSSVAYENIFACQFHPEKSQRIGLQFLRNFGALN